MTDLDGPLAAFVREHLGAEPREVFFSRVSMSAVHGVVLEDGRRVAVKVRSKGSRLEVACRAQEAARAAGIDCPHILVGPTHLKQGPDAWVTVEEWRGEGEVEPPGDPALQYAQLLADVNAALRTMPRPEVSPPPWLDYHHGHPMRTWPPPASDRWDPHRIEADLPPELPGIARAARARLLAANLPTHLMHGDLNPANVRWVVSGDVASPLVHDWDSVVVTSEAVVAGEVAADLTMVPGDERLADIPTCARLLAAFEDAREVPLTAEEREVAWATTAWLGAYNAAFEHLHDKPGAISDQILGDWRERLRLAGADK